MYRSAAVIALIAAAAGAFARAAPNYAAVALAVGAAVVAGVREWLGGLAGLFVPGGVLIGGALGAAVGGLWAKLRDIGISDKRMKELGDELPEGEVALFMLVDDAHRYHAMAELRRFPATLFYSTLGEADRASVTESLASGITDEGY